MFDISEFRRSSILDIRCRIIDLLISELDKRSPDGLRFFSISNKEFFMILEFKV